MFSSFFWLLLCSLTTFVAAYELNIVHINDAHAHIDGTSKSSGLCRESNSCYGGFSRIISKFKEIKKSTPNVLFLNAGDMFTGTPYFTKFKSDILIDFSNAMAFDAQALGNHEFDEGVPELAKYLSRLKFPVVCCNLDLSEEPSLKVNVLTDSIIVDVGNVKVGIVGYLTTDILSNVRGKVKILPEIPSLRKAASEMRKKGAQIIIGLGHSGYEVELEIAKEVSELDVLVGGHSHTFLYSGPLEENFDQPKGPYPTIVEQRGGKKVPVVQAFQFTKYLGHLKLEFDSQFRLINATGNPILLRPSLPRDEGILEIQEKWDKNISDVCSVVGEFRKDMNGDRTACRFQECNMGDFVTDALQHYALKKTNSSNVISFIQGGIIRSSIEKGRANVAEVTSIIPFNDPPFILRVTGAKLREALEFSVLNYNPIVGTPRFIQTAGLRIEFDLNKPEGSKLTRVQIVKRREQMEELDDSTLYTVVMSRFTYNGGDDYTMFNNSTILYKSSRPVYEILMEYLKHSGPYDSENTKRVSIVEKKEKPVKT